MKSVCNLLLVSALLVFGFGCSSPGPLRNSSLVGGGLSIHWTAPQPGTALLLEEQSGVILVTRSLDEGDAFEFDPSRDESDGELLSVFEEAPPKNPRFLLYFSPSKP